MKKTIILTGLLLTMLTGCGNAKEEAYVETKSEIDVVCEDLMSETEELMDLIIETYGDELEW